MLEKLCNHQIWLDFLEYKAGHSMQIQSKQNELEKFVLNREYEQIASAIVKGEYTFSIPKKHLLSKLGTDKKRVVYSFNDDENIILKFLAYILSDFDYKFCDNCYAFIKGKGCKKAFYDILRQDIADKYCYKIDISDYFNSIDINLLLPQLKELLTGQDDMYALLHQILSNDSVLYEDKIIHEQKGVMAGVPIAPFLANLYLTEMDEYFKKSDAIYARYSDDIILFGNLEQIESYESGINRFLNKYHLKLNERKINFSAPKTPWTFLGFEYNNGSIDLSKITVQKLKGKIKRKAKALMRWKKRKGADNRHMLIAMNKKFNNKFYSMAKGNELSYARWYFPVITTDKRLKEIDEYMQEIQRYMVCEKFSKANKAIVPYSFLKECGYRPLVSEYYKEYF